MFLYHTVLSNNIFMFINDLFDYLFLVQLKNVKSQMFKHALSHGLGTSNLSQKSKENSTIKSSTESHNNNKSANNDNKKEIKSGKVKTDTKHEKDENDIRSRRSSRTTDDLESCSDAGEDVTMITPSFEKIFTAGKK